MPNAIFLLPCRTFSNDAETGAFSIIEVLDQVSITVPGGGSPTGEGVVPAPWAIVNLWQRGAEDAGKKFEQRLTLVSPSGRVFFANTSEFQMAALKHRMTLRVNGFPVAGPGMYALKLDVRELPAGDWKTSAEYPIEVGVSTAG